jgi:hypothetical protein
MFFEAVQHYNQGMATGPSTLPAGITSKQKAEAANFEVFKRAQPNFEFCAAATGIQ